MNHSFNVDIATRFNVEKAILIESIAFWIFKNQANDKNKHDDRYWTYNTAKALGELFPYWHERKIGRLLKSLEDDGIIKSGNYNKSAYDRTKWYTIIDNSILQLYKIHLSELSNGNDESVEPIPVINTDINKDLKKEVNKKESYPQEEIELKQKSTKTASKPDLIAKTGSSKTKTTPKPDLYGNLDLSKMPAEISKDAIKGFIDHRKLIRAPLTQRALNLNIKNALQSHAIGMTPGEALDATVQNGWKGVNINWLRNKSFETNRKLTYPEQLKMSEERQRREESQESRVINSTATRINSQELTLEQRFSRL